MGKVYLVGAGPGNIDYLTLRGQQLLSQAEVLIYDALVEPQLLTLVAPNCLKIDVGKRGGALSTPQEKINQLLVTYCQQGKKVVRLKSGDPFIFGRATAEIEALNEAGCELEIVPGISSALAAPLLAGIPLTDSVLSQGFTVISAHNPESLDWQALSRMDTLVILMGGRTLKTIVQKLQDWGRAPGEAIGIIRDCSRPQQQVWLGTLADIIDRVEGISLSPCVIIIGEVVQLSYKINRKFPMLPLTGKTVLVTRAAEQSSQFRTLLEAQGATVIEMPTLEIAPPSSWQGLDRAIANLSEFDWLILTSANGVEYFFERLQALEKDPENLSAIKIAVVGKKTAAVLNQKGWQPDFIPPNFVADSLVENFPESLAGKKVLFPRVETGGREVLVKELTTQGAEVVEVAAYQSSCPHRISSDAWQALLEKRVDIITFASSKTVRNFHQLIQQSLSNYSELTPEIFLENIWIASIGPETSKTCQQLLEKVDIEAQEYTLEGLTQALLDRVNLYHFRF